MQERNNEVTKGTGKDKGLKEKLDRRLKTYVVCKSKRKREREMRREERRGMIYCKLVKLHCEVLIQS